MPCPGPSPWGVDACGCTGPDRVLLGTKPGFQDSLGLISLGCGGAGARPRTRTARRGPSHGRRRPSRPTAPAVPSCQPKARASAFRCSRLSGTLGPRAWLGAAHGGSTHTHLPETSRRAQSRPGAGPRPPGLARGLPGQATHHGFPSGGESAGGWHLRGFCGFPQAPPLTGCVTLGKSLSLVSHRVVMPRTAAAGWVVGRVTLT